MYELEESEYGDDLELIEEEQYLDESLDADTDSFEDDVDLAEILREALLEDYADATADEMDEALSSILDSMSPAESFNFAKALRQIEKGAAKALSDPLVGQIAATVLPVAGGAVGTLVGGPAGTALGSTLGTAAAKALPARPSPAGRPKTPGSALVPTQPPTTSPVSGGSAAAMQGLVLSQQPDVLKGLLALALGEQGRKSVNGVSVGSMMNLLSSVFGQAAADADELLYGAEETPQYLLDADDYGYADPAIPAHRARALYSVLMDAENQDLEEAADWYDD
jgi:hypothetical protein